MTRFTYPYPAMLRAVPRGCRSPKNVLVAQEGSASFLEMPEAEAPLACTITLDGKRHDYRVSDGRFFRPAGSVTAAPVQALPDFAVGALAFALVGEMATDESGQGVQLWPVERNDFIHSNYYELGRESAPGRDYALHLPGEGLLFRQPFVTPISGLSDIDQTSVAYWRARASDLIGSSFLMEGRLWVEADEPIVLVNRLDRTPRPRLVGLSTYRSRFSRLAVNLLPPYGNGTQISAFWRSEYELLSLDATPHLRCDPDAAEYRDDDPEMDRLLPYSVDLHQPEAFGTTQAALELDRLARIACVEAKSSLLKGGSWASGVSPEMRRAYRTIKELTIASRYTSDVSEGLDDALEAFATEMGSCALLLGTDAVRQMQAMLEAVDRWRSRPISLDRTAAPGPFSGRAP